MGRKEKVISMRGCTGIPTAAALIAAALVLGACDENELGRPTHYEKGVYLGPTKPALEEEKLRELRQRALRQRGS